MQERTKFFPLLVDEPAVAGQKQAGTKGREPTVVIGKLTKDLKTIKKALVGVFEETDTRGSFGLESLEIGLTMTVACLRLPAPPPQPASTASLVRGLHVVIGYQASWLLMFADYSRYTPSERKSLVAVFLGLALTSVWFMPIVWLGSVDAEVLAPPSR